MESSVVRRRRRRRASASRRGVKGAVECVEGGMLNRVRRKWYEGGVRLTGTPTG
jgi:hypothetical protein